MREHLSAHGIDEELRFVQRMFIHPCKIVFGLEITQHELPGILMARIGTSSNSLTMRYRMPLAMALPLLLSSCLLMRNSSGCWYPISVAPKIVIIVKDAGEHIHLFERSEVVVQLQPDIAAELFNFLVDGAGGKVWILKTGHQQGARQQILVQVPAPLLCLLGEIAVVKAMDKQFDPFLHIFTDSILPQVLKIGNDTFSKIDDAGGDHIENLFIRIINQVEQR